MNKKTLERLVKEHLDLINQQTLESAHANLTQDQFTSFWDVIVDRLIDGVRQELLSSGEYAKWSPEAVWTDAWDLLEKYYPQYILEPLWLNKFPQSLR